MACGGAEGGLIAVAGVSARILAEACVRDGFEVVALDLFGDADTRAASRHWWPIGDPGTLQLDAALTLAALGRIAQLEGAIGWIAGSGFEGRPELLAAGARLLPLIGTAPDAVRAVRDPAHFFAALDRLRIDHPEVAFAPPADPTGWLVKDARGCGGWHIRQAAGCGGAPLAEGHYVQRGAPGRPMSATFVAHGAKVDVLGINDLIVRPVGARPHVFCGAIGPVPLGAAAARRVADGVRLLASEFGLRGLGSLDFLLDGDHVDVLEVNPRPPATLALYGAQRPMVAHVRACGLCGPPRRSAPEPAPGARIEGFEIVFARTRLRLDADALRQLAGLRHAHDVPFVSTVDGAAGITFEAFDPVCTLGAAGTSADDLRARLGERRDALLNQLETSPMTSPTSTVSADPSSAAPPLRTDLSVNALVASRVERLLAEADAFECSVRTDATGVCIVDAGIEARGSIAAGLLIAEICMGGLGHVSLRGGGLEGWPTWVDVRSSQPVLACLGSQYAGWSLAASKEETGGKKFFSLGSGPARALAAKEKLYDELGYRDRSSRGVLVLEVDRAPPKVVIDKLLRDCGLQPDGLTLILTPTSSAAGTTQVVARVLEVALHKAHESGFALENIVDGVAAAPLPAPSPDGVEAMGRTNDAILYGGRVHLTVRGDDAAARDLARRLPSGNSSDHGRSFAAIFKEAGYDFYKIDGALFAPAEVWVSNIASGNTWHAGALDMGLLQRLWLQEA